MLSTYVTGKNQLTRFDCLSASIPFLGRSNALFRRHSAHSPDTSTHTAALRIHDETERGDNDTVKQPKPLDIPSGNQGVRRRRRRREDEAEAVPVGCCGGAGAA